MEGKGNGLSSDILIRARGPGRIEMSIFVRLEKERKEGMEGKGGRKGRRELDFISSSIQEGARAGAGNKRAKQNQAKHACKTNRSDFGHSMATLPTLPTTSSPSPSFPFFFCFSFLLFPFLLLIYSFISLSLSQLLHPICPCHTHTSISSVIPPSLPLSLSHTH